MLNKYYLLTYIYGTVLETVLRILMKTIEYNIFEEKIFDPI